MCGIIGGFDRKRRPFGDRVADEACRRIAHRGPDGQGHFEADGVLVGNRRLAILDLESGQQPMFSDDGQIVVVQNGEIYNFVELSRGLGCRTQCDTEVILRLYERDGEDFVRQLNGMFAIAIFDRRKRKLLLYRDRLGKKPLYLWDDGERLLFASEIKSLLAMGVRPEVDERAIDAYLTFNFVPSPMTAFRGITHLPPGHMLAIDDHGESRRAYWRLDVGTEEREEHAWQEELLATLRDATRIRLRSDVPLGSFLSGGVDSSIIVACMAEQMPHPVKTFCIGFAEPRFDESRYARRVADHCGTDHVCEVVRPDLTETWPLAIYHNDQPHGDVSFLPTYWVSKLARRHVKVVLTGDGGDELFAGYDVHRRFLDSRPERESRPEFERAYLDAISLFGRADKQRLYTPEMRRSTADADCYAGAQERLAAFRHQDRINQILGLDATMLLPGNNLVKPDKMAMAASLETRSPFLDYRMVELAFRIPGRLKYRDGVSKWLLKKAAETMLPSDIVHRPKQMFTVPIGEWFKTELASFVGEVLLSNEARDRGRFEPRRVARMIEEHMSGRQNHTRHLRAMIALELWHRVFIDASFDHAPTFEEIGVRSPRPATSGIRMAA